MSTEKTTSAMYNIEKLTETNYHTWVEQMEAILDEREIWNIVKGIEVEEEPVITSEASDDVLNKYNAYIKKVKTARAVLVASVSPSVMSFISGVKDPVEIWKTLEDKFAPKTRATLRKLQREFMSMKMEEDDDDVEKYTQKVAVLKRKVEEQGEIISDNTYMGVLARLPKEYDTIITILDATENLTPDTMINTILETYRKKKKEESENSAKALKTVHQPPQTQPQQPQQPQQNQGRGRGGYRGSYRGHRGRGRGRGGRNGRGGRGGRRDVDDEIKCFGCGKTGHVIRTCPDNNDNNGGQQGQRGQQGQQGQQNDNRVVPYNWRNNWQNNNWQNNSNPHIARVTYFAGSLKTWDSNLWGIDSCSNANIHPSLERIENYVEFAKEEMVIGFGGKSVPAKGSGSVTLVDEYGKQFTLGNVLFVPDAEGPIMSMMKVRRQGLKFEFVGEESFKLSARNGFLLQGTGAGNICFARDFGRVKNSHSVAITTRSAARKREIEEVDVNDENNEIIEESDEELGESEKLTEVQPEPEPEPTTNAEPSAASSTPELPTPSNLWHLRCVHASSSTLRKVKSIRSSYKSSECVHCILAKSHRLPFQPSKFRATAKLEYVHSDVCGPFPKSIGNSKYYVTFTDDLTRFKWVIPIKNKKSRTLKKKVEEWIKLVERQSGHKVKCIRTDQGREYLGDLTPFLKSLGVEHHDTAPFTPQSNGISERLNRVLNESIRAMLYSANMPDVYWAEAVTTAAYVWNRLPNSTVGENELSPYEMWFGKKPNLHALRPFGCVVYATVPDERQPKLSKVLHRAHRGSFVGYVSSTSWKFWDFERKCFDECNHVRFMETEFPAAEEYDYPAIVPAANMPSKNIPWRHANEPARKVPPPRAPPSVSEKAAQIIHDMIVVEQPPAIQVYAVKLQQRNEPIGYYDAVRRNVPISYYDAINRPDAQEWIKAMHKEMQGMEDHNTWVLCELPVGKKAIGLKWVFKMKVDGTGKLEVYKSRLVAKGYVQIAGLDFDETWAPVVRIESVRTLLAIAAMHNLFIAHMDARNAFLHGNCDFELYVEQPEGFVDQGWPTAVLRLNKSLYGLKQAPRIWYLLLCETICSLGFEVCVTDPSIYFHRQLGMVLAVFVDDILVCGPNEFICQEFYKAISQFFKMEYKGSVSSFLGLNIIRTSEYIAINQIGYIDQMLERFQMVNCKTAKTPLNPSLPLRKATATDKRTDQKSYQELTGSLNHAAVFSRPDIAFAVSKLSQFNSDPTETHMKAARHVLRYLKGTKDYSIVYGNAQGTDDLSIIGYADADHGGDKDDRKSTTGYIFMINNGAVSWSSHKQSSNAVSTMESEYMAISDASREAIARLQFYSDLDISTSSPPLLLSDSQSALVLTGDAANYQRAKHIDIRYHFIRDVIAKGQVIVDYIPTADQPADALTKALGPQLHQRCVDGMGLRSMSIL
jgi:transposase InsO family protein